jgi:adenylate cyclase
MARLILDGGDGRPRCWPLRPGCNSVGRAPDNTVPLNLDSVSRHHAEILLVPAATGCRAVLKDLGSSNGSFVNGAAVMLVELADGDEVGFGKTRCRFEATGVPTPDPAAEGSGPWSLADLAAARQAAAGPEAGGSTELSVLRLAAGAPADRTEAKLRILLDIGRSLAGPQDLDALLTRALELLFAHMAVDRACILLRDDTGGLAPRAHRVRDGLPQDAGFFSRHIAEAAFATGEPQLTSHAGADQRYEGSASIIAQHIHAGLCVPLTGRDGTLGALYVDNLRLTGVYTREDMDLLSAIGGQVGLALDNAALIEQARAEAAYRSRLERFFPPAVSRRLRETETIMVANTEVTAVFCDISDYTGLCSRLPPAEIIAMLNAWFELAVEEIIFPLGGTLEKYIGDALLALWGAPYRADDDADRAVLAAVRMQHAAARFNAGWTARGHAPIGIHIGLNTGPVAAGNIGSERLVQYAAIGDTTNVTSRICGVAADGEVVLADSTRARLDPARWPLTALPPTRVKGKDEPLLLHRLEWQRVALSD